MPSSDQQHCPMCQAKITRSPGRGRPRRFCGAACKGAAKKRVARVQDHLLRLEREEEQTRRDRSGLRDFNGMTAEERAAFVTGEMKRLEEEMRRLQGALEGEVEGDAAKP